MPAKTAPKKPSRDSTLEGCLGCSPGMQETKLCIPTLPKSAASNLTPSPSNMFCQPWPCWLSKDHSAPLCSSVGAAPGQFDELVVGMGGGRAGNTGAGKRLSCASGQLKHQPFGWPQRQSFICFSIEALLGAQGIFPDKDFLVTDVSPQKGQLFKSCWFLTQTHA